jgi:hypothetical protein
VRRSVGITTKKRYMKKKTRVERFDRSVIHMTVEDFNGVQKPVSSAKRVLAVTSQKMGLSMAKSRPYSGFT